jgi:hypothetical protein
MVLGSKVVSQSWAAASWGQAEQDPAGQLRASPSWRYGAGKVTLNVGGAAGKEKQAGSGSARGAGT